VNCRHVSLEPVILPTGETVARLCADCFAAVPPNWDCEDCQWEDLMNLVSEATYRVQRQPCKVHA
jgi:hypothetical protein